VNTGLAWQQIELRAGQDRTGRDVLMLVGPEPDMRWRAFTSNVVGLAGELGVRLVTGLGAFPAPVPHSRPVRVVATATGPDLAASVGFIPGAIDVPSGILGALERGFAEVGLDAVGLWARVPHYLANMPYPAAAVSLLEALSRVAEISVYAGDLREAAVAAQARVDESIANSEEHQQMVRQLEAQLDSQEPADGLALEDLPTGDELAAELQRFLRGEDPS
jgi:predicted ATP-grasp superfamily ATP-dependent carboligase